jgi:hypothetical protein
MKRKINLTKGVKKIKQLKRWGLNWKKNNISQLEIKGWNWKQIKILQRDQEKKLKIKIIRTEVEISIYKRTTLRFCMTNVNF